jgi:hypothetical protein
VPAIAAWPARRFGTTFPFASNGHFKISSEIFQVVHHVQWRQVVVKKGFFIIV